MKNLFPLFLVAAVALCSCQSNEKSATATANSAGDESALRQRVEQLAVAYTKKDPDAFMAFTNPEGVMFGTDSAEVNVGKDAILQQMKDDFATFESVRFGAMSNYHSEITPTMGTAFYDIPVTASSGGKSFRGLMRFATVWRKRDDQQWYLTQTLVSRPTKGQSSREMAVAMQKNR